MQVAIQMTVLMRKEMKNWQNLYKQPKITKILANRKETETHNGSKMNNNYGTSHFF